MKYFRSRPRVAAASRSSHQFAPPGPDAGPVIVPVGTRGADLAALEWAAAEAAVRGAELLVVHAFRCPRQLDVGGNWTLDLRARTEAEARATAAARLARRVMPSVRARAVVFPGRQGTALIREARANVHALIVLGQTKGGGRYRRALTRRLLRRTSASLAVIGLSPPSLVAPATGQVVVGANHTGGPPAVVGFAFRAAARRGTGLTILHAVDARGAAELEDTVGVWRMAYPDVPVRWAVDTGPVDSLVLAQSLGAALTVLGPDRRNWLRRTLQGSAVDNVLRLARWPVIIVGRSES